MGDIEPDFVKDVRRSSYFLSSQISSQPMILCDGTEQISDVVKTSSWTADAFYAIFFPLKASLPTGSWPNQ